MSEPTIRELLEREVAKAYEVYQEKGLEGLDLKEVILLTTAQLSHTLFGFKLPNTDREQRRDRRD